MSIAGTVIGPLTTTFTPPATCTNIVLDCPETCTTAHLAQQCSSQRTIEYPEFMSPSDCWPPGTLMTSSAFFGPRGFYSPGLICPAGWTSACSVTQGISSAETYPGQYVLSQGQTAVGCCPSGGYRCEGDGLQICLWVATHGDSFLAVTCSDDGLSTSSHMITMPALAPQQTASTFSTWNKFSVYAPMFEIRWVSSDRFPPSTAPPPSTATSIASPTPSESQQPQSHSTETALEIAIPLLAAVVAAILTVFFVRRRYQRKASHSSQNNAAANSPGPPPYSDLVQNAERIEMDEQRKPQEIDSPYSVHEMESPDLQKKVHEMGSPNSGRYVHEMESPDPYENKQALENSKTKRTKPANSTAGLRIVGQDDEIKPA